MNIEKFTLKPEYFDYRSGLHGISHTYRVMIHTLKLGEILERPRETWLAFNAAFIHDMARKNDKEDLLHGWRACKTKSHLLDLEPKELREAHTAVYNHCEKNDIMRAHPHYITAMILKDADLLDRVRMKKGIDFSRIRFQEVRKLITYAHKLLKEDDDILRDIISRHTLS